MKIIDQNKKVINAVKKNLPFELKENEKLMTVIFQSSDQSIHYPITCKDKLIFKDLENLLYESYPECKQIRYIFLINGGVIDRNKSLEENGIGNGQVILMQTWDESNSSFIQ